MTAHALPPPDFSRPMVTSAGMVTRSLRAWMTGVYNRLGQEADKVDAAHAAALAAAPKATQVIASGGLQVGGTLTGNVGIALYAAVTSVALLPAGAGLGDFAYAVDGRKAGEGAGAGTGLPVFWDGGAWVAIDSGAVAAA
jgi:hypothetical protein